MNKHSIGNGGSRVATLLGHKIGQTEGDGRHARKQGRRRVDTILGRIETERQADMIRNQKLSPAMQAAMRTAPLADNARTRRALIQRGLIGADHQLTDAGRAWIAEQMIG